MTEVATSNVVHEVLGRRAEDVDQPIIDYIINVLADEDFDFGLDGEGAFEALGELLVDSGCVADFPECRAVLIVLNFVIASAYFNIFSRNFELIQKYLLILLLVLMNKSYSLSFYYHFN